MRYKKILILTIILLSFIAIGAVSATENVTSDVMNVDNAAEIINFENDDAVDVTDLENDNVVNNQDNLKSSESKDNLSLVNEDVISSSSPSSSYYSASVSDTFVNYGGSGTIKVNINPCTYSGYYKYDFYLRIYDSNGNMKYEKNYYSDSSLSSVSYTFASGTYSPGTYTIKIVNYKESNLMDTATLTVGSSSSSSNYPAYYDYSVRVSDTTIAYGSSGSISMSISPSSKYYKYDYYLKVYDSNGNVKISKEYYGTSNAYSKSYSISSGQLSSGTYTIKLINYADNHVMDTATLTVGSSSSSSNYPAYYDYSVRVSDTTIAYGSSGSISMSISPSSKYYKYDYYLKVYDSNGNVKISKEYYGTSNAYSKSYSISSGQLSSGTYTIKLINYADNHVMDTATLTVGLSSYPYYYDYSVNISDTIIEDGYSGSIYMDISPSSKYYKYDYYLKVYDSNGNVKISKKYYGTTNAYSKTYNLTSNQLGIGTYTIKIENYYDSHVMDTAKLTVVSSYPSYNDYSVKVSTTTINYGFGGSISMSISPAASSTYKYDYYLKVYDSNNNEKISYRYYSASSVYSKTYALSSTQLSPGVYTIKIINNKDEHVMSTAKLTIKKITLETQNLVGKCDGIIEYKVRASENDIYKPGLKITFSCNGKNYDVITDNEGYATLKIHLKAGKYGITTKCDKTSNENIIEVKKVYVTDKYKNAYVKSLTDYFGGKNKIKYGWQGNLQGYFKIYRGNKLVYYTKLNSNGYIDDYFKYETHNMEYPISKIKNAGTYNAVITNSAGNVIVKAKIIINKAPTHIKCKSFVTKVGSKRSISVYVYDKYNSRKNIAGKVNLKINGKTYRAIVKNGRSIVKNVYFPLKVKNYKGIVKFLGSKNYKSSSVKFKVSARKLISGVYVYPVSTKSEFKTSLVAYVGFENLNGDIVIAKGGTVKFSVAGATYSAKVRNGIAKITITAPSSVGKYNCKAVYLESKFIKGSSYNFAMTVKPKPIPVVTFISPTSGAKWSIKKTTWERMKDQARSNYIHMREIGSYLPGYSSSLNVKVIIDGYVYNGIALAIKNDRSIRCEVRGIYGMRISNEGDYYF